MCVCVCVCSCVVIVICDGNKSSRTCMNYVFCVCVVCVVRVQAASPIHRLITIIRR